MDHVKLFTISTLAALSRINLKISWLGKSKNVKKFVTKIYSETLLNIKQYELLENL